MRRHLTKDHKRSTATTSSALQPIPQPPPQPPSQPAHHPVPSQARQSVPQPLSSCFSSAGHGNAASSVHAASSSSSFGKTATQTLLRPNAPAAPDVEMDELPSEQQGILRPSKEANTVGQQNEVGSSKMQAPPLQRKVTSCQSWRATGRYELWQCDELKCFQVYALERVIKRHKKYRHPQPQPSQLAE